MTKTADPARTALERQAHRKFSRGQALVVAEDLIAALHDRFKVPSWEAWATAVDLMRKHGQEPTIDVLRSAISVVNTARSATNQDEKSRAAGKLYCVLHALARWRMHGSGDVIHQMGLVHLRDHIGDLSTDPREELALAAAVVCAVERLGKKGTYGQFVVADARTMHAVALLKQPQADAREAGRILLTEQLAAMEELLAGELFLPTGLRAQGKLREVCLMLHAMALNNLARAWEQRIEGDRAENLRCAISLYEACVELPARVAEPEKLLHSLHHLSLDLRNLANVVTNVTERSALLARSMDVADRALELPRRHPMTRFPMLDPLKLNRAKSEVHWMLLQAEAGNPPSEIVAQRLREHCERALAWLRASPIRDREEGLLGAAFFARFLEQQHGEGTELGTIEALRTLANRLFEAGQANEMRFLTRDEATIALSALVALTPGGRPSSALATPEALACLAIVMGGVHSLHSGIVNARRLYEIEISWLGPEFRRLGPLGQKYIEDAFIGMHRWMCEPDLPGSHRRVFASQVSRLAALALDPELGLVAQGPLERARFHDLTGAAFYRAESTFYGQGVSHEAALVTEPGWRINLYRARQDLDHCATLQIYEDLRALIDKDRHGVLDTIVAALRKYQVHSAAGIVAREFLEPLEEMSRVRAEIQKCRAFGRAQRWSPADIEATPVPECHAIEAWLRSRPTTALLIAGDRELGLVYIAPTGCAEYQRLSDLCGEEIVEMREQANRLSHAWVTLLLGPSDEMEAGQEQLGTALADVHSSPGWRGLTEQITGVLLRFGLTSMAVIERGAWRAFPWGTLPAGEETLADNVAVVHLPTLAVIGTKPGPAQDATLVYVGAAEGAAPALEFGRSGLSSVGTVIAGPLDREAFEAACIRASVIRVFSHGEFSSIDAPLSGLVLNDAAPTEWPYQGHEIAAMDLRGCNRVELWACDSGIQVDFLGEFLGNDEPLGLASCFLLAGAHVVIGSLWKQPAMVAGLIAAAFTAISKSAGSAERDARALSQALAAYRRVVEERGIFEEAFCATLAASLHETDVFVHAVHTAWCAAAAHLSGRNSVNLPWSAVQGFASNGALLDDARKVADDQEKLNIELRRCAQHLMSALRGPFAWAGWRVLARDKSVF